MLRRRRQLRRRILPARQASRCITCGPLGYSYSETGVAHWPGCGRLRPALTEDFCPRKVASISPSSRMKDSSKSCRCGGGPPPGGICISIRQKRPIVSFPVREWCRYLRPALCEVCPVRLLASERDFVLDRPVESEGKYLHRCHSFSSAECRLSARVKKALTTHQMQLPARHNAESPERGLLHETYHFRLWA